MTPRVPCSSCAVEILPSTAERFGGRCAPCGNGTLSQRDAPTADDVRPRAEKPRRAKAPLFTDTQSLIDAVQSISDPEDECDLDTLQTALDSLPTLPHPERVIPALFGIFERFPWSNGFESFWGVLHALESMPDYASLLVASVRRSPGEHNLLMLSRMLNAGIPTASGVDILSLLREIAEASQYSDQARTEARGILDRQVPAVPRGRRRR